MLRKSVTDPAHYNDAIIQAVAKYYKASVSEFSDWKVLVVYDPSTEAKANNEWHALVYAPAGAKPASFVDVVRDSKTGIWGYNSSED